MDGWGRTPGKPGKDVSMENSINEKILLLFGKTVFLFK